MLNSRHCMNPITYLPSLYYQMSKILNFAFLQWIFCICIFFHTKIICFGSVQSLSHVWLFVTPWSAARQASLSITNSRSPPKPMSIELVMPSTHLILCCPLLLLPSIFPSIRVFSNESTLRMRWPKYWRLSFNISLSNEHPGLISFRMDWLDLLAVQGTLKSLRQHHSSKASILQCSAFFIVQLSHPYMTTGKTIALTRQTFVGKVMSLLFNLLWLDNQKWNYWDSKWKRNLNVRLLCPWNFQGRILESVAISYSRRSSLPRVWTHVSCIGRQILYHFATWVAHYVSMKVLVTRSCPTLCDPTDCSPLGSSVYGIL